MESKILVAIPRVTVAGASGGLARGRCQVDFRPEYLVVPRHIAPWFEIDAVMIGKNSQFHGVGGVPAGVFAGDLEVYDARSDVPETFLKKVALDVPIPVKFDVCRSSDDICILIQNLDACARHFHCVFYGTIVG